MREGEVKENTRKKNAVMAPEFCLLFSLMH